MQGVSQEKLAETLGLTFQQVQKYERGTNRVSASKLHEIAIALRAPISYFFDGLADPAQRPEGRPSDERAAHTFLMTTEGLELAKLFPALRRDRVRRRFLDLLGALAGVNQIEGGDCEG